MYKPDFSHKGAYRHYAVNGELTTVQVIRRTAAGEILSGFWAEFRLVEDCHNGKRFHVRHTSLHSDYDSASRDADAQALALAYSEDV